MPKPAVSPSRQYVVLAINTNFDGHVLKGFTLPEVHPISKEVLPNNADVASHYYLNYISFVDCIENVCLTREAVGNIIQK